MRAKTAPPLHIPMRNGVGASRVFCPAGKWPSALDFLCERFAQQSRSEWAARFAQGDVLNAQGDALPLEAPYLARAVLHYFRALKQEPSLPYEATVLYEDEHLVLADKPHFLPVIPSGQYLQETLLIRLKRQLNLPELSPLHRIDRDTAGLVLFSKRAQDRGAYQALFREGQIAKTYLAIAPYLPQLQLPLQMALRLVDAPNFMQMQVVVGEVNSRTTVQAVAPCEAAPHLAQYTLQPHTGKRHQLRIHMLHLGAPICGDGIYPALMPERDISQPQHPPLQLLAQRLQFRDPITGDMRAFVSERHLQVPLQAVK